jgi:hypothetical protein
MFGYTFVEYATYSVPLRCCGHNTPVDAFMPFAFMPFAFMPFAFMMD